ncbi:DUF2865 domain-containing protein [Hansschlegelia zhihuaiae]|uniref:DUF2865 domain-containing protein n=1 Tax=Hansschlegelia zhihuaiae TaxID=405005 RepID=A0A4Q0MLR3_9HYPH|nr:DUF2865 domain-containing protein [Hansschlegelia zhihuaiae]RXF74681.1 DUF2865 domain-containing protein [Hansschlegelia zhihuaiae]
MRSKILTNVVLAVAFAAVLGASGAGAQEPSEECLSLEARLAALDRSGPRKPDPRQLEQSVARQQSELDRTSAYAKGIGCGRRFIFAPEPPAECEPLGARIKQMQINLDRLKAQSAQAAQGGGGDPRRRELLFALARGHCGPQYRLVERRVAPQQQEKKGFFEMLFGGGRSSEEPSGGETVVEPEMDPAETPKVSTFRTVCVRTCDGFFFPISYQTTRNAFGRDEAICRATCPGAEAKLFAYPNPGGKIEGAADVDGQPYAKLENAFRYRKEFVSGCSCKPEGMNWAEALSGVEDKTVKKGDIVVDEKTAEEMSRAKTPEERAQIQARAAKAKPPAPPASPPPPPPSSPLQDAAQQGGEPFEPQQTGAARREAPSDDVIILDQPPMPRGGVERRPLDGPDMERVPH